jgi:hypothetical protein
VIEESHRGADRSPTSGARKDEKSDYSGSYDAFETTSFLSRMPRTEF